MRIVVHGQQAFGKSVLEALVERGENVIAVYCAPDPKHSPIISLCTSRARSVTSRRCGRHLRSYRLTSVSWRT